MRPLWLFASAALALFGLMLAGPFVVIVAYTVYRTLVGQPMAGSRTTS